MEVTQVAPGYRIVPSSVTTRKKSLYYICEASTYVRVFIWFSHIYKLNKSDRKKNRQVLVLHNLRREAMQ